MMTNEEAIEFLENLGKLAQGRLEPINIAIRALEQEPCEDAISRQAVLDYAKDTCLDLDKYEDTEIFCDEIKDMPSVTPTRKKGKWITDPGIGCKCSECGRKPYPYQADSSGDDYWKPDYCPNCGIEMESEG